MLYGMIYHYLISTAKKSILFDMAKIRGVFLNIILKIIRF